MNFLELVQYTAREATVSGTISSVTGQVGEIARVVNDVANAYRKVQTAHADWEFLRRDVGFATTATKSTYTALEAGIPAGEFGEWMWITPGQPGWRAYLTAQGFGTEQPVRFMDYNKFKQRYLYGNQRTQVGRPLVVTQRPDQTLVFWPIPDDSYTIVGEQYHAPYQLVANADVPCWPAKFHDAVVYRALMLYAEYEGDPTVMSSAQGEYNAIINKMEEVLLPDWDNAGPMA